MPRGVKFEATDEQIESARNMLLAGVTQTVVAKVLGIHYTTYQKHVQPSVEDAIGDVKGQVVGALMKSIKKEDITAIIFFLKTQCGWSEKAARIGEEIETGGKSFTVEVKLKDDEPARCDVRTDSGSGAGS